MLRFSKEVRVGDGDGDGSSRELYREFRKKVEVFIAVCKGLGEKKADKREERDRDGGYGAGGENPIETLVLMLDMGGFYGKKSSKRGMGIMVVGYRSCMSSWVVYTCLV